MNKKKLLRLTPREEYKEKLEEAERDLPWETALTVSIWMCLLVLVQSLFSPLITFPFSETVCWTWLSMCVCFIIAGRESLSARKLVHWRLEFVCRKCSLLQNFSLSGPGLIWSYFLRNRDQMDLKYCLGSLKNLSLSSLQQGPKEFIDP